MQTIERLIGILENYVEADEIQSENHFKSDLGMSSFDLTCVMADIKNEFGVNLTASDFVRNKTVGQMAAFIDSQK